VHVACSHSVVTICHDLNLVYFRQGPERGDMTVRVKLHAW
jgi:hypothetical protein